MSDYLTYLKSIQNKKTSTRLQEYLRYNFSKYVGKGSEILEIGPGIGEFLKFAVQQGARALDVIDRDEAVMNFIRSAFPIRLGLTGSVENLPSLSQQLHQYDLIFMLQVMEHAKKECLVNMLQTLYRHLKPGGALIITVPNGANPLSIVERYSDITHENLFSENSLRQLVAMSELGDSVVIIEGYRIPPTTVINFIRVIAQRALHFCITAVLAINGGVFFRVLEPNITLIVRRPA